MVNLHASILKLFSEKAPAQTILDTFKSLGHPNDTSKANQHTFLCYAIHYGYVDLVKELLPDWYHPKNSILKPLISAVNSGNKEIVDILLQAGITTDVLGYGLFQTDRGFEFHISSAMDIVMQKDDVETMMKLMDNYHLKDRPLAHLALKHNAEKCFLTLVDMKHHSLQATDLEGKDLLLAASSSRLSLLQRVVGVGFSDHGQTSSYARKTSLHCCVAIDNYGTHRDTTKANFIPQDVLDKINLLLKSGAKAKVYDSEDQLPLDLLLNQPSQQVQTRADILPLYTLEQHSQVILQCTQMLLQKMKAETPVGQFVVPYRTLSILQGCVQGVLMHGVPEAYTDSLASSLNLTSRLTSMILEHSIDLHEESPHLLLDAFFQRCVCYTVRNLSSADLHPAPKFIHEHILKLLAFGSRLTKKAFPGFRIILESKVKDLEETVPICLSMMQQELYEAFRLREGTDGLLQESVRGLREICRLKLYDQVAGRNMAVNADQIPLPGPLKSYLTLGLLA